MAKVTYASLKLKLNTEVNTFKFNDAEIEVLKYLPISEKYDIIMIALQKAEENGIYNELKLDMYLNLYMIYSYTNVTFTDKQKEDETKLYDTLVSNGFVDEFMATMDSDEYNEIYTYTSEIKNNKEKYSHSIAGVVNTLISELPAQMEAAAKVVESFNPEQYQKILDLANATGMNNGK